MNSVILIGNLTKDPEVNTTPSGINYCSFNIAVKRKFKNEAGEYDVDFIPIMAWRTQADNCGKYLKKGSKVAVNGSLQTRTYEAEDGTKRFITEVVANSVEFLNTKTNNSEQEQAEVDFEECVEDPQLPF